MAKLKRKAKVNNSAKVRKDDSDIKVPVVSFSDKLHAAMYEYGVYTVENRAIPELHDGLKPVHRRILWAAYKLGFKSSGTTYKTARLSGDVIGKFHPHGQAAVDGTINGMIEGTPCPLLHGQGNFGSYSKMMPAAAARYTELKLNTISEKYLLDPYYLKVVPYVSNYDGQEIEPAFLPAKLPFVLALGAEGIAVSVTTQIPAYTLDSLRNVVVAMMKGEENTKKLAKMLQFASFYGGTVLGNEKEQHEVFKSSASKLQWVCDYNIVDDSVLTITGLHPAWNYDSVWQKIKEMPEVASANDLSSGLGAKSKHNRSADNIRLEVKVKKNADVDKVFDKLEKMLTGSISYKCNVMSRSVDTSEEMPDITSKFYSKSPYEILRMWIKWRLHLEKLALRQEMVELKLELIKERLLLLACQSLDVIFALLKQKNIDKVAQLSKKLNITIDDAKYIWSIAVGRLDRLNEQTQLDKIKQLRKHAEEIRAAFDNPKKPVLADLQNMQLEA